MEIVQFLWKPMLFLIAGYFQVMTSNNEMNQELLEDYKILKKKNNKRKARDESFFRRNLRRRCDPPNTALEPINVLEGLRRDPARRYIGKHCHMEA